MKLKNIKNFDEFEQREFLTFLIELVVVCVTAYLLAINSYMDDVFVGFFSFALSMVAICASIYIFPYVRDRFSSHHSTSSNLGRLLLVGINGERPTPIKRDLEELIRRTKI